MSLLWMHGFDNITNSDRAATGYACFDVWGGNNAYARNDYYRRAGGKSLWIDNDVDSIRYLPEQNNNTIFMGFGFWYQGATYNAAWASGPRLMYAGTNKLYLNLVAEGVQQKFKLNIKNGAGTTLLTSNFIFSPYTWYFLEVKVKLGITTNDGEVELRVNDIVDKTVTGVNTNNDSSGKVDRVNFRITSGSNGVFIDDFYILNDSGTYNNNYLGDVAIEALYPNADGTYTQWTPSTGTSHYAVVDETISNPPTTDYIYTDVLNNRDSFQLSDLVANTNIKAIMMTAHGWKTDSSLRKITPFFVIDSVDYSIGTEIELNEAVKRFDWIVEKNPNGNVDWTKATLDAIQIGMRVTT